jgi:anaerobic ribonucleoside-triphosphate reductase activating protein
MQLYFSHAHFPVTTLGFGRRVGIWLQGCSLGCPGCVAPHTWQRTAAHRVELAALVARLREFLHAADGITISGGEPFEQPAALQALIAAVRRECAGGDVLVYSGFPEKLLRARHPAILAEIDVLIPEPFRENAPSSHPLTGSSNQTVLLLSELARQRYQNEAVFFPRRINVAPADDRLRLAGIPRRGEMARLASVAAASATPPR